MWQKQEVSLCLYFAAGPITIESPNQCLQMILAESRYLREYTSILCVCVLTSRLEVCMDEMNKLWQKVYVCTWKQLCATCLIWNRLSLFLQLFCCMLTFSTDNINGDTDVHGILHCLFRIVLLNISCIYLSTFSEDLYLIAVWLWLHTFYTSSRSWHVNEPYLSLV